MSCNVISTVSCIFYLFSIMLKLFLTLYSCFCKCYSQELQGVIWPPHINERPNSVFKEKLIEFLIKPFTQEEYDRYFALASDRIPMVKERRTRNTVAYYHWTHEMSKSYFDRYPGMLLYHAYIIFSQSTLVLCHLAVFLASLLFCFLSIFVLLIAKFLGIVCCVLCVSILLLMHFMKLLCHGF
jgi:hypothetical protein